jgi:hypothetical protein
MGTAYISHPLGVRVCESAKRRKERGGHLWRCRPTIVRGETKPWKTSLRVIAAVAVMAALTSSGCANPKGIPGGASLVTEATVKSSFQSPADGMLYIYRSPARGQRGQLHYSGPILAGQTLVIDPAMKQATLDGQPLDVVLPSGDVLYQAYFRRDPTVRQAVSAPAWPREGRVREAAGTGAEFQPGPGPDQAPEQTQ